MSISHYLSVGSSHFLERSQGCLRLRFLDNTYHCIKDNDNNNGRRVNDLSKEQGNNSGNNKDNNKKIIELIEEQFKKTGAGFFSKLIRTMFFDPSLSLSLCQTFFYLCLKLIRYVFDR